MKTDGKFHPATLRPAVFLVVLIAAQLIVFPSAWAGPEKGIPRGLHGAAAMDYQLTRLEAIMPEIQAAFKKAYGRGVNFEDLALKERPFRDNDLAFRRTLAFEARVMGQ